MDRLFIHDPPAHLCGGTTVLIQKTMLIAEQKGEDRAK
jgi:hypothetical protein